MIKIVTTEDWTVIYGIEGEKIWEGHFVDESSIIALSEYFDAEVSFYEFTDEDEIDVETPNNFNDIVGIKEIQRYKTCSSYYFLKWKNDSIGCGLCEYDDGRTHADNHLNCKYWKGKRYKRKGKHNEKMD